MSNVLPVDKNQFYEIRFHSIGGQGAYTTGQMLASLASTNEELKTAIFASYGSEKKGAPVAVFVRFIESQDPITNFSPIKEPNIVCVFHEKLLRNPEVLDGLKEDGTLVVNTDLSADELRDMYNINVKNIVTVDATKIALETKAKINTVLFGTLVKELPFLDVKEGEQQISDKLSYKYPHLVESNIAAYNLGFKSSEKRAIEIIEEQEAELKANKKINLGYETQIYGGVIDGANAYTVDRSISREGLLPAFEQSACINCTKCDLSCPDDCFVWEEKEGRRGRMEMVLQGIDYQHCKGCLRCVEACPTDALETIVETREYANEHTVGGEV